MQLAARTELWVPAAFTAQEIRDQAENLAVVGRLRDGISLEAAQSELAVAARGMAAEFPMFANGFTLRARPMAEDAVAGVRSRLWILFGVAGFVFLIACANVASLLVARSLARVR